MAGSSLSLNVNAIEAQGIKPKKAGFDAGWVQALCKMP
jgi:hypothetical protein